MLENIVIKARYFMFLREITKEEKTGLWKGQGYFSRSIA